MPRIYGLNECPDQAHAVIAVLTYWAFVCRHRKKTPAMGSDTWTFLRSAIQNSAGETTTVTGYLQNLCDKLIVPNLIPERLTRIVQPRQEIRRMTYDEDGRLKDFQERESDRQFAYLGWDGMLESAKERGFEEWDLVQIAQTKANIIEVICRIRFQEDKALGEPTDAIDVEAESEGEAA